MANLLVARLLGALIILTTVLFQSSLTFGDQIPVKSLTELSMSGLMECSEAKNAMESLLRKAELHVSAGIRGDIETWVQQSQPPTAKVWSNVAAGFHLQFDSWAALWTGLRAVDEAWRAARISQVGVYLLYVGNHDREAEHFFACALAKGLDTMEIREARASLLERQGRSSEAKQEIRKARELAPYDPILKLEEQLINGQDPTLPHWTATPLGDCVKALDARNNRHARFVSDRERVWNSVSSGWATAFRRIHAEMQGEMQGRFRLPLDGGGFVVPPLEHTKFPGQRMWLSRTYWPFSPKSELKFWFALTEDEWIESERKTRTKQGQPWTSEGEELLREGWPLMRLAFINSGIRACAEAYQAIVLAEIALDDEVYGMRWEFYADVESKPFSGLFLEVSQDLEIDPRTTTRLNFYPRWNPAKRIHDAYRDAGENVAASYAHVTPPDLKDYLICKATIPHYKTWKSELEKRYRGLLVIYPIQAKRKMRELNAPIDEVILFTTSYATSMIHGPKAPWREKYDSVYQYPFDLAMKSIDDFEKGVKRRVTNQLDAGYQSLQKRWDSAQVAIIAEGQRLKKKCGANPPPVGKIRAEELGWVDFFAQFEMPTYTPPHCDVELGNFVAQLGWDPKEKRLFAETGAKKGKMPFKLEAAVQRDAKGIRTVQFRGAGTTMIPGVPVVLKGDFGIQVEKNQSGGVDVNLVYAGGVGVGAKFEVGGMGGGISCFPTGEVSGSIPLARAHSDGLSSVHLNFAGGVL